MNHRHPHRSVQSAQPITRWWHPGAGVVATSGDFEPPPSTRPDTAERTRHLMSFVEYGAFRSGERFAPPAASRCSATGGRFRHGCWIVSPRSQRRRASPILASPVLARDPRQAGGVGKTGAALGLRDQAGVSILQGLKTSTLFQARTVTCGARPACFHLPRLWPI